MDASAALTISTESPSRKSARAGDLVLSCLICVAVPTVFWVVIAAVVGSAFGLALSTWTLVGIAAATFAILTPVWASVVMSRGN